MSVAVLKIINLSYAYRSDWLWQKVPALEPFDLDVYEGEAFGFLGHNGAGKTTTIKCILNLIQPQTGEVLILNQSSREPRARSQVGYLPEQPYFYDHLSVQESMDFYATLAGLRSASRTQAIEYALARLNIANLRNARLRTLSKGLTQRLAMAQAIVAKPKLLILDEPFSGLDPLSRKEFRDLIFDLKRAGATIFMSSHILSDVEFICDRVSIMVKGALKGVFDLKHLPDLYCRYELAIDNFERVSARIDHNSVTLTAEGKYTRLAFSDKALAEQALKAAIDAGCQVETFEKLSGGLEELFIALVSEGRK